MVKIDFAVQSDDKFMKSSMEIVLELFLRMPVLQLWKLIHILSDSLYDNFFLNI